MATRPVPVPPVRPSIIGVPVRPVIITGRIVGGAVEHRHGQRNRESNENAGLGPRLEQHRYGKSKRKDQKKSSHNISISSETSHLIAWLPSDRDTGVLPMHRRRSRPGRLCHNERAYARTGSSSHTVCQCGTPFGLSAKDVALVRHRLGNGGSNAPGGSLRKQIFTLDQYRPPQSRRSDNARLRRSDDSRLHNPQSLKKCRMKCRRPS
jgi:hypothetical protein